MANRVCKPLDLTPPRGHAVRNLTSTASPQVTAAFNARDLVAVSADFGDVAK